MDEGLELCLSLQIVTLAALPDVCAEVLSRCRAAHPERHELCHIFRWENWGLMKLSNLTLSLPLVSGKGAWIQAAVLQLGVHGMFLNALCHSPEGTQKLD